MFSLEKRLAGVLDQWNLLKHPFYVRWAEGELTREELANYACQYAHIVRAIPFWLAEVATQAPADQEALEIHAAEEGSHVELWEQFALALGVTQRELHRSKPNPATTALLRECDAAVREGTGAAAVWALEAQSPQVSATKLTGLEAHYGIDATSGGEYFALHQDLDRAHEAELRRVMMTCNWRLCVASAGKASSRLWDLLSSVERVAA